MLLKQACNMASMLAKIVAPTLLEHASTTVSMLAKIKALMLAEQALTRAAALEKIASSVHVVRTCIYQSIHVGQEHY